MRKVKIIKVNTIYDYDEYDSQSILAPVTEDWEEISDEKYASLREAVNYANMQVRNSNSRFVLVEYTENSMDFIFKTAKEFLAGVEKKKRMEEERKEAEKKKKAEAALARKRKQLEKLKIELEDE